MATDADADGDEAVETEGEPAESETTDDEGTERRADAESGPVGDGDDQSDDEETAELTNGYDDTVPNVELSLYQLSVRVSGRSDDDLKTVEESATRLMNYLIERAEKLEERPDDRGLS